MQSFVVQSDEIEGRLDSFFYSPQNKLLTKSKFPLVPIKDITIKVIHPPEYKRIYSTSGYQLLRAQNVRPTGIEIESNKVFFDKDYLSNKKIIFAEIGDVLIVRSGVNTGDCAVIDKKYKDLILGADNLVCKCKENVNPFYLKEYLNLDTGKKILRKYITGATNSHITPENLEKIKIPLPPLEIQNQIVDIMRSAQLQKQQKEEEAQRLIDSIDGYVLDELGIKLPEGENKMCFVVSSEEVQNNRANVYYYQPQFKEVEKALEKGKYRIAKLKEFVTKIHYGVSIKNVYVDEGIPLLRILNIEPNKLDLTKIAHLEESKRKEIGNGFVYEGDLLISRSGSVGIVAVVPKEADGFAFGSFMIKFCVNHEVNKAYVSIWLNNKISKIFTEREKIGAIQGNITISTIENFLVPLPPLEIQNKIADEVRRRIFKAERLKAEASKIIEDAKKKVEEMILGD
jgi:restriction endonuclease S subunit